MLDSGNPEFPAIESKQPLAGARSRAYFPLYETVLTIGISGFYQQYAAILLPHACAVPQGGGQARRNESTIHEEGEHYL